MILDLNTKHLETLSILYNNEIKNPKIKLNKAKILKKLNYCGYYNYTGLFDLISLDLIEKDRDGRNTFYTLTEKGKYFYSEYEKRIKELNKILYDEVIIK